MKRMYCIVRRSICLTHTIKFCISYISRWKEKSRNIFGVHIKTEKNTKSSDKCMNEVHKKYKNEREMKDGHKTKIEKQQQQQSTFMQWECQTTAVAFQRVYCFSFTSNVVAVLNLNFSSLSYEVNRHLAR